MIRFDLSTHIYRPLPQVFAFVATPENNFQWQYGTLASSQISRGEFGIGALFRVVGHLIGRRIETVYEVTILELNQRYGFKSVSGPLNSYTLYSFEISQGGTKLSLFTETHPTDVLKPDNTVVVKKFKKEYKENLGMLKSVLEAHQMVRT
jgi:hypothetical protein